MAIWTKYSGTLVTSNKYLNYRIGLTLNSQNIASNTSNVTVFIQAWRNNTGYTTNGTGTAYCTINGTAYSQAIVSTQKITYNSYTQLFSQTLNISHDANGAKTLAMAASIAIPNISLSSSSQSASIVLNTIPRYTSITGFSATVIERNRIDISWSAANACNYWWYSLNGGSTWVAVGAINAASGSLAITGLAAGTAYSLRVRVRRSDSNLTTDSGILSRTTLAIAAPNTPTLRDRTCTGINVAWSSNRTVIRAQYSINGGGWQNGYSANFGATTSGHFWINGLTPNTTYGIRIRVLDAVHTGSWSGASGAGNMATFRLNTSPGASFSTGNSVAISLSRATTSVYSDVTLQVQNNSNSYINIATLTNQTSGATFSLSAAQLNTIYSNRINAKTTPLRFMIVNRWGSSGAVQGTSYSSVGTCTIANALPSIDGVSYIDTNLTVQGILNGNLDGMNFFKNYDGREKSVSNNTQMETYIYPTNDGLLYAIELEPNTTYTMSGYFKSNVATDRTLDMFFVHMLPDPQHRSKNRIPLTTQYVKHTFTFATGDNPRQLGYGRFDLNEHSNTTMVTMFAKELKLEKGNVATPFKAYVEPETYKLLRNLSTLQVTAGQATSQKYATLKSYKVSIGGGEYTTNTSGTSETGKVVNVGKVNQSANQTAVLTVTDSRGYTATRSFTVQILDYLPPQFIQASADRLNAYEETTTMNIEARRSIVRPSTTDLNVIDVRYRLKENPSGEYGNYINVNLNESSVLGLWKHFTASQYMADYPNNKSYTVELGIKDTFTDWSNILITLPEGIALFRFLQDKIVSGVPFVSPEITTQDFKTDTLEVNDVLNINNTLNFGGVSVQPIPAHHSFNIVANLTGSGVYVKIAELKRDVASGYAGGSALIAGGGYFGYPTMDIDVLHFGTRGPGVVRYLRLMSGGTPTTNYGYVDNSGTGIREIWVECSPYSGTTTVNVLNSGGTVPVTFRLFTRTSIKPSGWVNASKINIGA